LRLPLGPGSRPWHVIIRYLQIGAPAVSRCPVPAARGGAGHLRESRCTIVRSGHVSNHNHENPRYQSAAPKAALCAGGRFCFASSYQIMELMIAAAKGARIYTFVRGNID
jgi:hypothetical protein